MPEGRCKNKNCRRLIYDTEKVWELPDKIECQHCHHINTIRRPKRQKEDKQTKIVKQPPELPVLRKKGRR